jgi:CxxC-x17-CxxC domain-containing protein
MFNKPFGGGKKKPGGYGARGGSSFGDKRGGGGKSFGGGRDWKPMHDATCASCGVDCKVPFRPNGRKPVMCSNCFTKDGDSGSKRYDRPRGDRPSGDSSGLSDQLKEINGKLDAIMRSLDI